jgi:uncharacterized protein YjiS (DUF1127 family)
MALYDTARTHAGADSLTGRLSAAFDAVVGYFIAWNDARVTRNSLSKLTDRELDDIGLARGDIDEIVARSLR